MHCGRIEEWNARPILWTLVNNTKTRVQILAMSGHIQRAVTTTQKKENIINNRLRLNYTQKTAV